MAFKTDSMYVAYFLLTETIASGDLKKLHRCFDYFVTVFVQCVLKTEHSEKINACDMWSWIQDVWNDSDYTENVSLQELRDYLDSRFLKSRCRG